MLKVTPEARTNRFENELCGCFKDYGVCCTACVCPAVQGAYDFANSREEACTCCHCICRPSAIWTRMNIRLARGMKPNICGDCASYFFCYYCSICQDAMEINSLRNYRVRNVPTVEPKSPPPLPPAPGQHGGWYGPPVNPVYYGPPIAPVNYQPYQGPPVPTVPVASHQHEPLEVPNP